MVSIMSSPQKTIEKLQEGEVVIFYFDYPVTILRVTIQILIENLIPTPPLSVCAT